MSVHVSPSELRVPVVTGSGVSLATEVFLPEGQGPWPALLMRTPYGITDQREPARAVARRGFAAVVQDVRGRFGSGGDFDLGASDANDGAATVEWSTAQPWCDGRVGGWGASYPGLTQWKTAVARPRGLACVAPVMSPVWWRGLDFRTRGPVDLVAAAHWLPRQAAAEPGLAAPAAAAMFERAVEVEHLVPEGSSHVDLEAALSHPGLGRDTLADPWPVAGSARFEAIWRSVYERPAPPPWRLDPGPGPDSWFDAPALVVTGWYDPWVDDSLAAFGHLCATGPAASRSRHRIVVTPFGHGFDPPREMDLAPAASRFGLDADLRWAEEHLLDRRHGLEALAPVTWYVIGAGRWREAPAWPPPGSEERVLFLAAGGSGAGSTAGALVDERPDRGQVAFEYDPARPVPSRGGNAMLLPPGACDQRGITGGARADVVSFDGPSLPHGVELAGPVRAEIHLSTTAPDTDLTVKLLDVDPSGRARNVVDGVTRLRYRYGPDSPPPVAGRPEPVVVELGSIGYLVRPGHHLRVDVSSSNFPRFDRNPNTGAPEGSDGAADRRVARQTVHTGAGTPSCIHLTLSPEET